MMSVLVVISRLTGFVRTWAQAFALGVTVLASCYSVANNLPTQLYEIVVGGMLVTAFLPVYMSVKEKAGSEGASRYASNLTSLVVIAMGAVSILSFVFAAQVVWTQSFSAGSDFDFDLAVYFFRFFAIEVVLYALSSIVSGILNAERDYFWSTAAPIANNFVTTASFLLYAFLADSNPTLALVILALGNPLGVAVQVAVQVPALRRHGVHIRPFVDLSDPSIKDTLKIGIPSLIVMLCSFVTASVMTSSALSVTGVGASVSAYARLWYTLPYAIFAVPITTALFTELSDDVARDEIESVRTRVMTGTSKILFYMIPFGLFLIVFSVPLTTLLAAGKFSDADITLTASYLAALSTSLPAYGVVSYLQKVCSSLREMGLYAIAHVVAAVVQTFICLVLTPHFGMMVVALSSTAYMLAVTLVTFLSLQKPLGALDFASLIRPVLITCAISALGAAVGFAGMRIPDLLGIALPSSTLMAFVRIICGGIPALIATFGAAFALKMPEADFISRLLGRFVFRNTA